MVKALALRGSDMTASDHDTTAAAIARLTALVDAQERTIRQYEAKLAHSRYIFEQTSAAARLGLWECCLNSETLSWSNSTYDLFDLAPGTPLRRQQSLAFYPPESLRALETIRTQALKERRGFSLDVAIMTPKNRQRWIRIHATVECAGDRPTRLFGLKQDITEEKAQWDRTRYLAEYDDMTGLANRTKFHAQLAQICSSESDRPPAGALLLIDLDGFKDVNDSLGHIAGDACLRETAQRLERVCGRARIVARVGGDEFGVLLDTPNPNVASELAARITAAMRQPIDHRGRQLQVGASVGVALVDGCPPLELFRRADIALYSAKAGGRSTFRFYNAARMPA